MLLLKQTISKLEKMRKFIAVVRELQVDTSGPTPITLENDKKTDESVSGSDTEMEENNKNASLFKKMGGLETIQKITEDVFSVIEKQD